MKIYYKKDKKMKIIPLLSFKPFTELKFQEITMNHKNIGKIWLEEFDTGPQYHLDIPKMSDSWALTFQSLRDALDFVEFYSHKIIQNHQEYL